MTRFSKLNPDGTETDVRHIEQSNMLKCPHFIIVAEHYRADQTCKCDDPEHKVMKEWGYKWRNGQWR